MDEITLNATWLNTDGGGQGECVGWTARRTLNRQSDRLQEHYCFMHSNEIPRLLLLLLRMNYVCVTVLICAGHPLWGNVGHMLMHNKRFRLYSHQQRGRLAPIFSSSYKTNDSAHLKQLLPRYQARIPLYYHRGAKLLPQNFHSVFSCHWPMQAADNSSNLCLNYSLNSLLKFRICSLVISCVCSVDVSCVCSFWGCENDEERPE